MSAALAWQASPATNELGQFRMYFDVIEEMNLPTWWAASLLLTGSLACLAVAWLSGRRGGRVRWSVLAALVALLSLDEATVLHERLDRIVLPWLSPEDFPYLWVVPGSVLGTGVVVCVVRLVRTAPRSARRRLILGLVLLLGSAVGGELVQGWLVEAGLLDWPFVLSYHLEEAGETLGAVGLLVGAVSMFDVERGPSGVRVGLRAVVPPSVGVRGEADDHLPGVPSA